MSYPKNIKLFYANELIKAIVKPTSWKAIPKTRVYNDETLEPVSVSDWNFNRPLGAGVDHYICSVKIPQSLCDRNCLKDEAGLFVYPEPLELELSSRAYFNARYDLHPLEACEVCKITKATYKLKLSCSQAEPCAVKQLMTAGKASVKNKFGDLMPAKGLGVKHQDISLKLFEATYKLELAV